MSRTKKRYYRILSFLFCFLFLLFAGCDGGPLEEEEEESLQRRSLAGTKVLSKPADYSFSQAVGEYSENYYNLFSREILSGIYEVYSDFSMTSDFNKIFFEGLTSSAGETTYQIDGDGNLTMGDDKYYLFDTPRYTIKSVETTTDGSSTTDQVLTLDTSSAWLWSPVYNVGNSGDSTYEEIIFVNSSTYCSVSSSGANLTISIDASQIDDWKQIYAENSGAIPNYSKFYIGTRKDKDGSTDVVDYWTSPFYEESSGAVNYFQDALEYATYLFVLGYDYSTYEADGSVSGINETDAPYFDFEVQTGTNGYISDVMVGGWGSAKVSIKEALANAKALYKNMGTYVGVNNKNKQQIARFVKDKVIGANAYAKDKFTVQVRTDGGLTEKKFNRNYDKIIENVVNFACTKAPIGRDAKTGNVVNLENNYLASEITDYDGDYFFASYEEDSDDNMFEYIEDAEYQSMVIYPERKDVGKNLTDIWLAFEYNPNETFIKANESITINVGFRYYSCSANGGEGGYLTTGEKPITIKKGHHTQFDDDQPDVHWLYICDFASIADIKIPKDLEIGTQFNNSIGEDAINPYVNGTKSDNGKYATQTIDGSNEARKYYKLNDSSSYGAFGALNGEKFSKNAAGEDACDFIEIYFDIQKERGKIANYNFKVALIMYYAEDANY